MQIELEHCSLARGQPLRVRAIGCGSGWIQMQVHVFPAGVENPEQVAMKAAAPENFGVDEYALAVECDDLGIGTYEVVCVRLSKNSENPGAPLSAIEWLGEQSDVRCYFEITETSRQVNQDVLAKEVAERSDAIERAFRSPVHAVADLVTPATQIFTAFVFVRGMLLSTRVRFRNHEVIGLRDGLDERDKLERVNTFFRENGIGVEFPYGQDQQGFARSSNPISVFHFPAIFANSPLEVRSYVEQQTELALLALSLTRDASGSIFDTVVLAHGGGVTGYARGGRYEGNRATGWLAGESAEQLTAFTAQLQLSALDRFLVALYKEARREPATDFQYVRLWAILETLAEERDYDENQLLLDFENQPMAEGGSGLFVGGRCGKIFSLMRDAKIGSTEKTWRDVNVWFAFRTAAAHHGAITNFTALKRPQVRAFAEGAWQEIMLAQGHDSFLWELQQDVRLLLMRKLSKSSPWGQ